MLLHCNSERQFQQFVWTLQTPLAVCYISCCQIKSLFNSSQTSNAQSWCVFLWLITKCQSAVHVAFFPICFFFTCLLFVLCFSDSGAVSAPRGDIKTVGRRTSAPPVVSTQGQQQRALLKEKSKENQLDRNICQLQDKDSEKSGFDIGQYDMLVFYLVRKRLHHDYIPIHLV